MGDYDRTRAIVDGRVKIDGVDPTCMLLSPEECSSAHSAIRPSTPVSCRSVLIAFSVARGDPHYIAVPVFLSRAFRHTSIYVRNDKGISEPSDLKGKRIGIAEYQLTANVWARAILADHGVQASDVTWVRGGMNTPGRPEKIRLDLADDIKIEQARSATLNALLEAGEIDGFIGPRSPKCFDERHPAWNGFSKIRWPSPRITTSKRRSSRSCMSLACAADWRMRTPGYPALC